MGIQVIGNGGVVIGGGEEAVKPLHVAQFAPVGVAYRYSGFTGTIGAALAANSELLQFRFLTGAKTRCIVRKVMFDGIGIVVIPTAVGPLGFMMKAARSWSVAGSAGTRISFASNNLKLETAESTSQVNDLGIATTGALTAGTKTKDANAIGQAIGGVGTGAAAPSMAVGPALMPQPLLDASSGGKPLVLADQEGFTIDTTHVGPAALTYVAGFTIDWIEVAAF